MNNFLQRDNRPILAFLFILIPLILIIAKFQGYNLRYIDFFNFFSSRIEIKEKLNSLYSPNVQFIKLLIVAFWILILSHYYFIFHYYKIILEKENRKNFKYIFLILTFTMPYIVLPTIWIVQSENYRLYYRNKQKISFLNRENVINEDEVVLKNSQIDSNYQNSIINSKIEINENENKIKKGKLLQQLQDLKSAGVISQDEYDEKVSKL